MNTSLGDISLRDYRRITVPRRKTWLKRLGLGLLALLACGVCTAAGDFYGPWTGKSSRQMSLQQAMAILAASSPEEWQTEIGLGVTYSHLGRSVEGIRDAALRGVPGSKLASDYLRNLGIKTIQCIKALQLHGDPEGQHAANLAFIRKALDKE